MGATVGRPGPEVTKGPCYIGWSVCHLTDQVVTTWYEGSQWGTNGSFSRRKEPHQCTSDLGITMDAAYRFLVWQLPSFLPTTRLLSATLRPTVTKETKEFQHLIFFTEGSVHRVSQLITWVSLSSKNRELYHVNRAEREPKVKWSEVSMTYPLQWAERNEVVKGMEGIKNLLSTISKQL